tara:strand:+ start:62121 stop:62330 length:210 start_codon:yes stop_codon:yes gene_type:complete
MNAIASEKFENLKLLFIYFLSSFTNDHPSQLDKFASISELDKILTIIISPLEGIFFYVSQGNMKLSTIG